MKQLYNIQFFRFGFQRSTNTYNRLLLLLLVSLCFPLGISAQGNRSIYGMASKIDDFYPVSAEAAALFTKVPEDMDYCRGRITFRIPLYEIKTPSFTLPIVLTYTTGGIKVGEQTGAVGLGWHLEAEPAIAREIRGLPDDHSLLRDSSYQKNHASDFLACVGRGTHDQLNDLFHYRTLESSGKFYLNRTDNLAFRPSIITADPAKVFVPGGHVTESFQNAIHLTDAKGSLYVFGETSNARETTTTPNYSAENTAWKVSRIQSMNGEKMTFTYKENFLTEQHIGMYDYYAVEDNSDSQGTTYPGVPSVPGYWKGVSGVEKFYIPNYSDNTVKQWGNTQYYPTGTAYVNTRRISQINFLNGRVQFNYSSLTKTLESIQVYNSEERLIKEILFESTLRSYERVLLNRILIKGSGNTVHQKYEFNYKIPNEEDYSPYTKGIDLWGYYNGANNADLVPVQTVPIRDNNGVTIHNIKIGGATNRNPSFRNTLFYALDKITYPTGGYTEIIYEQNVVDAPGTGKYKIPAGGVRIRELRENPSTGPSQRRTFTYRLNIGHSFDSGYMLYPFSLWLYKGAYIKKMKKVYALEHGSARDFRSVSKDYTLYLQDNIYTSDNSIYYNVVEEDMGDIHIQHVSPRADYIRNSDDSYIPTFSVPIGEGDRINAYNIHQTESGESIHIEEKMTDSHLYTLPELERTTLIVDQTTSGNYIRMNEYYERAFREKRYNLAILSPYPKYILTTDSLPGKSMKKELKYRYGHYTATGQNYNQLTEIEQSTPEGDNYRTEYSYAHDKNGTPYDIMVAKNDVSTPVEERQYVNDKLKKTIRYAYRKDDTVNSGYCLDKIIENTDDANTEFRDVETYDTYLSCGRPLQVTRKDGTKVSFLWAFGGEYAIAIAENLTIQEIRQHTGIDPEALASGKANISEVYQKIKLLRETCPQAHITMYYHIPLIGTSECEGLNGISRYNIYDTFGRLQEEQNLDRNVMKSYEYNLVNPSSNN